MLNARKLTESNTGLLGDSDHVRSHASSLTQFGQDGSATRWEPCRSRPQDRTGRAKKSQQDLFGFSARIGPTELGTGWILSVPEALGMVPTKNARNNQDQFLRRNTPKVPTIVEIPTFWGCPIPDNSTTRLPTCGTLRASGIPHQRQALAGLPKSLPGFAACFSAQRQHEGRRAAAARNGPELTCSFAFALESLQLA